MKTGRIVIAIVSLFTATIAHAQYDLHWPPGMGPYFRIGAGPAFFQPGELKGFGFPAGSGQSGFNGPTGRVKYNVGFSGNVACGLAFDRYVGLDFQTGYTWARMSSVQNFEANSSTMGNVPFLANLTLSLPIPHTDIIPYIGGGVGGSDSVFDAHNFTEPGAYSVSDNEDDVVFAWQAFAGVRFALNPRISIDAGYDFFMTGNPTFRYPFSSPPPPSLNVEFEGVRVHSIMAMLQVNF